MDCNKERRLDGNRHNRQDTLRVLHQLLCPDGALDPRVAFKIDGSELQLTLEMQVAVSWKPWTTASTMS
jgi:hypothetical protein